MWKIVVKIIAGLFALLIMFFKMLGEVFYEVFFESSIEVDHREADFNKWEMSRKPKYKYKPPFEE